MFSGHNRGPRAVGDCVCMVVARRSWLRDSPTESQCPTGLPRKRSKLRPANGGRLLSGVALILSTLSQRTLETLLQRGAVPHALAGSHSGERALGRNRSLASAVEQ